MSSLCLYKNNVPGFAQKPDLLLYLFFSAESVPVDRSVATASHIFLKHEKLMKTQA